MSLFPEVGIGVVSETGPRERNEDFAGALLATQDRPDVAAALADGIGGARGGRIAAETAVRFFLDGMGEVPETMEIRRAGARILDSVNGWLHAQGRQDLELAGMGCTLTALVLRGRQAHVLHVGDTRAYRFSAGRLSRLTDDHVREGSGGGLLTRALGIESELRLDYANTPVALHDRFLLCTDGVHRLLADETIAAILRTRSAPADTSRALVAAAFDAGSTDNTTALVLDVVGLPTARRADVDSAVMALPIAPVPRTGETVDGFVLKALISDGPASRIFSAADELDGGELVLKFPKGPVGETRDRHAAFIREAWVGRHVEHPSVVRVLELPPGRQTCLYTAMPFYEGETLERRLGRRPSIDLAEGRRIGIALARATACLHRVGIIHRDIKPDNVILRGDSLTLLDLGAVRLPGLEEEAAADIPGTLAYAAPEMRAGEPGNVLTDLYALGTTLFRALTSQFPYGNPDATSPPRLDRPAELALLRPDLPAWFGAALARAIAREPAARFRDTVEFGAELEAGPEDPPAPRRPPTLYERAPVRVWQAISALLAIAFLVSLLSHR